MAALDKVIEDFYAVLKVKWWGMPILVFGVLGLISFSIWNSLPNGVKERILLPPQPVAAAPGTGASSTLPVTSAQSNPASTPIPSTVSASAASQPLIASSPLAKEPEKSTKVEVSRVAKPLGAPRAPPNNQVKSRATNLIASQSILIGHTDTGLVVATDLAARLRRLGANVTIERRESILSGYNNSIHYYYAYGGRQEVAEAVQLAVSPRYNLNVIAARKWPGTAMAIWIAPE